jgi:formamidopyrimidine-DNA glycosylase
MPELPEVETIRRALSNMVLGKTIETIEFSYDKILRDTSEDELNQILSGKSINGILRYGKYLVFEIGEERLISHLRMEGKYFVKHSDEPVIKHEHMIIRFTDGTTLRYHDTRKFGTIDLRASTNILTSHPINQLGFEPFDDACTPAYLYKKIHHKIVPIKTALLDQTIIAGLGNIYVNEVLFRAKIHPKKQCRRITKRQSELIIKHSNDVLLEAIKQGGTTIRSYTSSLGVHGRFQQELYVHGREGDHCEVCHSVIKKIKIGGRGTYYCPTCQQL